MVLCATLPTIGPTPLLEQEDVRLTEALFKLPGTVSATTKSMGSSDDLPICFFLKGVLNFSSKMVGGSDGGYLIHILCGVGSVFDDDGLMPG